MRKVGDTSEFIYHNDFFFFKKKKQNTCRYHFQILDMICISWDIEQNILQLVTLGQFLTFTPVKLPPIIKILKNEKICWIHHHFTHVCQKLQYMMYGSWDTECNRQNFFVILDNFLPFYPSNNTKNQNFEKMKKSPGHIIILHKCNINGNHIMYHSWDTKCDRNNFCHFGPFFAILPLNNLKY